MQPDLLDLHVLHHFRTRSPLTHCMTNDVVQTFTANVLLALGASPADKRRHVDLATRPVDASGD